MSDNIYKRPDAPAGWSQYEQLLKHLPVSEAPADLFNRIDARLSDSGAVRKQARGTMLRWVLVPAMGAMALVGGFLVSGGDRESTISVPQATAPVANDAAPNGQRNYRRNGRRLVQPMIESSDTALQIDTTPAPPPAATSTAEEPVVPGIRPTQRSPHSTDATTGGTR
jgi:hypothetical protein